MAKPLRDLLVEHGLTAAEVARRAGLSKSTLSQILLGQHGVRWSTALQIASVFGVRPDEVAFPCGPSVAPPRPEPQAAEVAADPKQVA